MFTYATAGTFTVSLTAQGLFGDSTFVRSNYVAATNPIAVLLTNSMVLSLENCTNGGVDPDETVTMTFGFRNVGSA